MCTSNSPGAVYDMPRSDPSVALLAHYLIIVQQQATLQQLGAEVDVVLAVHHEPRPQLREGLVNLLEALLAEDPEGEAEVVAEGGDVLDEAVELRADGCRGWLLPAGCDPLNLRFTFSAKNLDKLFH